MIREHVKHGIGPLTAFDEEHKNVNNTENQTICVVVPVYNAEKYLVKCIKSVVSQSFTNWRLVLIDDGSTDNSGAICEKFAVEDDRIVVIHKSNNGSVEARKTGVLCEAAQASQFISFLDADDTLTPDALRLLYDEAVKTGADCVCANILRMWKGIRFPKKYQPPCFQYPKVYSTNEILNELYISCFGISNYPVTLYAKLYQTALITSVIENAPVVKFMGDDLSLTVRLLPNTQKLSIIPSVVYNYRVGGNTSRFMPYMLDDFLGLYRLKMELQEEYPMPQDAEYYLAVELLNIILNWFEMFRRQGKHTHDELCAEIEMVANLPEVLSAHHVLKVRGKKHRISDLLANDDYAAIAEIVERKIKKDLPKNAIKQLLYSL